MQDYHHKFEFEIKENLNSKNKIKTYFKHYNFEQIKENRKHFVFVKKWNLLAAWNFNPIDWESRIEVQLIENKKVEIQYTVENNNIITPVAFKPLYEMFVLNLEQFINRNKDFIEKNKAQLKLAKNNNYKYNLVLILGLLLSILLGFFLAHLTDIKFLKVIISVVLSFGFKRELNKYLIKKNALK